MGAHLYVRAPVPSACSMLAHSTLGRFLVLLLLISTVHLVNGSDSETLIEFKDSLINGENLTTWIDTKSPCNNNRANWEGLLCTNGTIWGIKLEGKGLEGNIDPNILARLPSLVSISFNNNSLEGAFPDFRKLDGMREIFLSNNKFFGEIPANAFKGLKWLKKLYLANNELMGQIPLSLTTLPKLKELMLENNHFEGEIPKFDEGKLTLANFANNHLHGRIPEGLQNFPDFCSVYVISKSEVASMRPASRSLQPRVEEQIPHSTESSIAARHSAQSCVLGKNGYSERNSDASFMSSERLSTTSMCLAFNDNVLGSHGLHSKRVRKGSIVSNSSNFYPLMLSADELSSCE